MKKFRKWLAEITATSTIGSDVLTDPPVKKKKKKKLKKKINRKQYNNDICIKEK